jgi:hypothetical protein
MDTLKYIEKLEKKVLAINKKLEKENLSDKLAKKYISTLQQIQYELKELGESLEFPTKKRKRSKSPTDDNINPGDLMLYEDMTMVNL